MAKGTGFFSTTRAKLMILSKLLEIVTGTSAPFSAISGITISSLSDSTTGLPFNNCFKVASIGPGAKFAATHSAAAIGACAATGFAIVFSARRTRPAIGARRTVRVVQTGHAFAGQKVATSARGAVGTRDATGNAFVP